MNDLKKKQIEIEIAKKIVEQGDCHGIDCCGDGHHTVFPGVECPLYDKTERECKAKPRSTIAWAYLEKQYLSSAQYVNNAEMDEILEDKELMRNLKAGVRELKEDLLERVENLEKKVEGLEISSELHECKGVKDARKLKEYLESDILSLVAEYEKKTGLKVSKIDLKTGPFLFLDIFKRDGEEQRNEIVRKNHIVNVKTTL